MYIHTHLSLSLSLSIYVYMYIYIYIYIYIAADEQQVGDHADAPHVALAQAPGLERLFY